MPNLGNSFADFPACAATWALFSWRSPAGEKHKSDVSRLEALPVLLPCRRAALVAIPHFKPAASGVGRFFFEAAV